VCVLLIFLEKTLHLLDVIYIFFGFFDSQTPSVIGGYMCRKPCDKIFASIVYVVSHTGVSHTKIHVQAHMNDEFDILRF
jgi:hypothetical protein